MMSYKTYFTEVFDNPYEYKKVKNPDGMRFRFKTDDGDNVELDINFDDFGDTDIVFTRDKSMDMTGSGNAFRIFGTIKDILQKNKKKILKKSDRVSFSAKSSDNGRVKFYNTIAKWLKKEYGGYSIEKDEIYVNDKNHIQFTIGFT